VIWVRLCAKGAEGPVIDDGVYTTLRSSHSFDDLVEVAWTFMGPHAASKMFKDMEITSLDLVEGDLSISEIQTRGPARRRIRMDSEESWRKDYTSSVLRHCASVITMMVNGEYIRS
jgi:hypothetical protein